jgi:hypothetical protein
MLENKNELPPVTHVEAEFGCLEFRKYWYCVKSGLHTARWRVNEWRVSFHTLPIPKEEITTVAHIYYRLRYGRIFNYL